MISDLNSLIAHLEADPSLFEPSQLRKRIETLDALDAHFGDPNADSSGSDRSASPHPRKSPSRKTRICQRRDL